MTVMYVHGYGSDGNATKGRLLREMLPDVEVVSPTFDYDHATPWQIQEQISDAVTGRNVCMLVGSSFGGYHVLCATRFFHGPVWAVNPVRDVVDTIRRIVPHGGVGEAMLREYERFDVQVFRRQQALNSAGGWPADTPLHFALSSDDELLGDHAPLLDLFPDHGSVVWKDRSGHRFMRFAEIKNEIASTLMQ